MSNAHDELKAEVAERLRQNTEMIARKRELAEALRLEIKELREAIELDERLDKALNPRTKKTAQDLYGEPEDDIAPPKDTSPATPAAFRPE